MSASSFSLLAWAKDKLIQAPDLATSSRRQLMLTSSTLARQKATPLGRQYIEVGTIRLLHATTTDKGSKGEKRKNDIKRVIARKKKEKKNKKKVRLSAAEIDQTIPSADRIQVARSTSGNRYITLQGVGRLTAIFLAARELHCLVEVEVEVYSIGGLFDLLERVSTQWYDVGPAGEERKQEGRGWKLLGLVITLTLLGGGSYYVLPSAASLGWSALSTVGSGLSVLSYRAVSLMESGISLLYSDLVVPVGGAIADFLEGLESVEPGTLSDFSTLQGSRTGTLPDAFE